MRRSIQEKISSAGKQATLPEGFSRRDFLATAGVGALGLTSASCAAPPQTAELATTDVAVEDRTPLTLRINGHDHRLLVEPRWSLLFVLREKLGLTGTKEGCHRGECGSCTVLIDGVTRYACLTLVLEAEGTEITTLEGLLVGEDLGDVQQAFAEHDGYQCGYCTPGQIMSVEGLLRANADPTLEEIRVGVSGNLCRCGAYANIFRAAQHAAELKAKGGRS